MPFKPATKEIGFVKASMFGPKGTGKTKPESQHFGECRKARAAIRKARGD